MPGLGSGLSPVSRTNTKSLTRASVTAILTSGKERGSPGKS